MVAEVVRRNAYAAALPNKQCVVIQLDCIPRSLNFQPTPALEAYWLLYTLAAGPAVPPAALPNMMGVLHSRPAIFQSLQAAVDWAVRSGMCKNKEMAGVSLVSQLVASGSSVGGEVWSWRTPLAASRQYWEGWYTGLSDAFLALPLPKMLLLAGTDR